MTDNALIAASALDSLTAEPPLLGPWSSGYTNLLGDDTFHPGPLLFWLLALPGRLLGTPAFVVTAAVVNVLAIVGCVVLARRRGGLGLMVAVAIAIPVMLASVPTAALSDIWNPSLPLLPFMLLVFVAWSLACGEHRLLPLAVLLVSFVAHCHLGFLVPAVAALAVGVAGLWLSATGPAPGGRCAARFAAVVGLACWIGRSSTRREPTGQPRPHRAGGDDEPGDAGPGPRLAGRRPLRWRARLAVASRRAAWSG